MAEFVYQFYKARKAVHDKVILDDVTVGVYPGAKIGVVGPNGAGKSTLLKVIAGLEDISNGEAHLTPGYTVGILQQEPPLDETKTVKENIELAFGDIIAKVERFNAIGEEMGNPDADFDALMAEMGQLQDEIDAANGWDLDSQLSQAMDALQCPDPDEPVTHLSGGERRRVALCKLLLEAPDLLLLDEPTNHLDAESVLWLEQFLHRYPGAVMAVTHDRYFLDDVAEWICEVDRGQLYPYEGNYSTYLEKKAARLEAQGQQDARRAKKMKSELEWVRSSPKARQAKSKARLAAYEKMEAEARASKKVDFTDIQIPVGPRLGAKVLARAEALDAARSEQPELFDDLATAYARAHNLADASLGCEVDAALLGESERALLSACEQGEQKVVACVEASDFAGACSALAELREPIDRFFEDVLVMDEDTRVRENRLRLLNRFASVFADVANIGALSRKK